MGTTEPKKCKGSAMLRKARLMSGQTQQAAAKSIGISQTTLCDYENARRTPQMKIAARIKRAFDVPLEAWV